MKRIKIRNALSVFGIVLFAGLFLFSGCGAPVRTLDKSIEGPQLIVNPDTIGLSVAGLKGTKIVFSGAGFQPEDSVFIKLLDVPDNGKKVDMPVASGEIRADGTFDAEVGILVKVNDIMRAKIGMNDEMENIVIITGPPMPQGTYTARAVSMLADKSAQCTLKVEGPSLMDSFKDWLGGLLGKIVEK